MELVGNAGRRSRKDNQPREAQPRDKKMPVFITGLDLQAIVAIELLFVCLFFARYAVLFSCCSRSPSIRWPVRSWAAFSSSA